MSAPRIAIVGATGLVGEMLLRILDERRFPLSRLDLFASSRSAGAQIEALGQSSAVKPLDLQHPPDFSSIDLAFFAAGSDVSRALAPVAAAAGTIVIDKSAAFRLAPDVPLIVPEVNRETMRGHKLIANPNCAVIPLAVMLAPVARRFGLQWVSVATYQSVSGAGRDALREFERQLSGDRTPPAVLPRRIAGNVFPDNGPFDDSGYNEEERKIAAEFKKILSDETIRISATSVRVPVAVGHGEAVAFGTRESASREQIALTLREADGVKFLEGNSYATPLEVVGNDDVVVGRLRADDAHPGGYLAWVMSDNLRKGAATNAVQIAEAALSTRVGAKA
jgi:aspartate-semialdehyde dehydrogenase